MACTAGLTCGWFVSFADISAQRKLFANTRIPFFAFILNFIKFCPNKYFKISVLALYDNQGFLLALLFTFEITYQSLYHLYILFQ